MRVETHGIREGLGRRRTAFTLIEILVVVAIIALLISILLPALSTAREHARSSACAANINEICTAEQEYEGQSDGWIPGSPITTGFYFTKSGKDWMPGFYPERIVPPSGGPPQIIKHPFNRFVLEWFDFATPLRAMMADPKSIPKPPDRATRQVAERTQQAIWLTATDGVFHCPSNPHTARAWQDDTILEDWPVLRAVSYLTMSTIMRAGPSIYDRAQEIYGRNDGSLAYQIAQSRDWELAPPEAYVPKNSRLGRQVSKKVFVADGLRFYSGPDEPLTINVHTNNTLGAMTAVPPSTFWPYGREYNLARTYSYRHSKEYRRMNAGFFDGHVEVMTIDAIIEEGEKEGEPRFVGKAVNPAYYYPSGTLVRDPSALHMNTILPDTKLP